MYETDDLEEEQLEVEENEEGEYTYPEINYKTEDNSFTPFIKEKWYETKLGKRIIRFFVLGILSVIFFELLKIDCVREFISSL